MDATRVYSKPKLIVLGRGAPEENVLCGCKSHYAGCGSKSCTYRDKHNVLCFSQQPGKS